MREYVFLLEYERGVHPIRDVFIDNPEVVVTALDISLSRDRGWRIERMTGPEQALDTVETAFFNEQCNDCTYPTHTCDAAAEYEVLEREPTARTIYRHVPEMTYCHAVSYLALTTLGTGLVFDATQRGPYYQWRLLIPSDRDIESFHRALQQDLPDGVTLDLQRAGAPDGWPRATGADTLRDLPYKQREALETARRLGYYEHQGGVTLADVAEELALPLTTLQYRLRRAEDWATATALSSLQLGSGPADSAETTERRDPPLDVDDQA
jgi:hypothetical protein